MKFDKIFTDNGENECNLEGEIKLTDRNGKPINIGYKDKNDIIVNGRVFSKECNLDISFKTPIIDMEIINILLFVVIIVGSTILSIYPLY